MPSQVEWTHWVIEDERDFWRVLAFPVRRPENNSEGLVLGKQLSWIRLVWSKRAGRGYRWRVCALKAACRERKCDEAKGRGVVARGNPSSKVTKAGGITH